MDNTKAYWTAHKEFYLDGVLGPMQALMAELAPEFGDGHIFRPYRDTRFSSDKSPYKTTIAAHNDAGYVSLSSDALGVGSGLYMPSPDQLSRFRARLPTRRAGRNWSAWYKDSGRSGSRCPPMRPSSRPLGATRRTIPASSCSV
jgi:uncharacterized protein (DUF2461 family)